MIQEPGLLPPSLAPQNDMLSYGYKCLDDRRAEELSLRLFRAFPQSKRFVPEDPKQLAVFEITPVAVSLVDYTSGFGKTYLIELPSSIIYNI